MEDRITRDGRFLGLRAWFPLAVLVLAAGSGVTAAGLLLNPNPVGSPVSMIAETVADDKKSPDKPPDPADTIQELFKDWQKPDLALVLSGQQHGYLQPCGCSVPQKGGLARRYNFIQFLREKLGWPVVAADAGDVAQKSGPQAMLKYIVSMHSLEKMNYSATVLGENEGAHQLFQILGEYALNNPRPGVLASNLKGRENFPGAQPWVVQAKGGNLRVGFAGVVGPTVAKVMTGQDPTVSFDDEDQSLRGLLNALQNNKADLLILLYQGYEEEARRIAKAYPQFQVIVYIANEEEPPSRPQTVGATMLINVGHKGRYVGVVGVQRMAAGAVPFELKYKLVPLDPEYETPSGKDADNPIHALLQEYAEKLKNDNYLAKYPTETKHRVQVLFPNSEYIGSDSCEACHQEAYKVWRESTHPDAYETLVNKAKRPNLREFDGECVLCHVTGFTQKSGFSVSNQAEELKGVTCESCHGPCSEHKKQPKNVQIHQAINPWRFQAKGDRKMLDNQISIFCQTCHDADNDVHFKFEDYWVPRKIAHYTPKDKKSQEKQDAGK